jgi:hypothetical protein
MICVSQQQSGHGMAAFVNQTQRNEIGHRRCGQKGMAIINKHHSENQSLNFIGKDKTSRLFDYFVSFIQQNMFTMSFSSPIPDLFPMISTSPVLYHATIAVGALHASRHSAELAIKGEKPPSVDAMNSYHKSMGILRSSLENSDVMRREDLLWATFFLGLFEV